MKRNAGIKLDSMDDVKLYSDLYLSAFRNCDLYTGWEPWGDVYKCITQTHNEIRAIFPDKKILWGFIFDIFHYIKAMPWTFTLKEAYTYRFFFCRQHERKRCHTR